MNCSSEQKVPTLNREAWLLDRFGEVMSLDDLAYVLKYSSVAAIRKAHARGTLSVDLRRLPNRAKWFACTRDVAECLNNAFECSSINKTEN